MRAVSSQRPDLSYLCNSALQTPGMCRWREASTHLRSEPESRVPRTRRVKAPCARTVMEKGLANFLSHATFTSAPGPIARNPPASGRLDHWHPGGGDATRLPTSQWLHDEPGTAPLQEGLASAAPCREEHPSLAFWGRNPRDGPSFWSRPSSRMKNDTAMPRFPASIG